MSCAQLTEKKLKIEIKGIIYPQTIYAEKHISICNI